jgi:F-type H+-transporting ATPase subunit epsilon
MAETSTHKIDLEVVTPRGRVLAAEVDEVTAPSVEGEFGVLPGHLPMVVALRSGLLTYRQGGETRKCAVGAGFGEVGPHKLVVLTDEYCERDAIDPVVLRKELAEIDVELGRAVADATPDPTAAEQRRVLVARQNWIAAQLELYGDPPPATMRLAEIYGPPPTAAEEEAARDAGEGSEQR